MFDADYQVQPRKREEYGSCTKLRTIDIRTTGRPLDPSNVGTMIKPAELVDAIEITPLNRSQHVLYNQLIAHAWDHLQPGQIHRIRKSVLRGSHESNDRLDQAFDGLMRAYAKVRYRDPETGKKLTMRVSLLGDNIEEEADNGFFAYTFSEALIGIIENSTTWARLKSEILYLLRSKYSVRLYEVIERRINMHQNCQEFEVNELRGLLGVPQGKLTRFADFNKYALKPAIAEINHITDYIVTAGLIKRGRTVHSVQLLWQRKTRSEISAAFRERESSRIGRKARQTDQVEQLL